MMYQQELSDFIEILNDVLAEGDEDCEEITLTDDIIESIDWLGDDYHGYRLTDTIHEPFCTDESGAVYKWVEVNDPEQYKSFCKELLRKAFLRKMEMARVHIYHWELGQYIREFAKRLKDEWKCFRDVSLSSLPIRITEHDAGTDDGDYDCKTQGTCLGEILISIFNASPERRELDEQSCRHETIHYMLIRAGIPNRDDSAFFWFFATIYDACPYKEMDEKDSAIFNCLMDLYRAGEVEAMEECLQYAQDTRKGMEEGTRNFF